MRIVIIGSGNLATQLSLALHDAGKDIVQVFSRTADHAKCLADKLGCTYTSDINAISPDADIYIISVKDDA
ncbi:MAG: NAD(P)-binding domain-containing protein, partial [Prevotella sp.]|nr:NAD(P)-binding domain-containing protein [Prevotella sp.]